MRYHLSLFAIIVLLLTTAARAQNPVAYTVTDLGTLSGLFTTSFATGINNRGQVAGYSEYVVNGPPGSLVASIIIDRPFLYDGAMHDVGLESAQANAVNDRGQIVGKWYTFGSSFIATSNGKSINASTLTDSESHLAFATAINNAGQIVGEGYFGGFSHAFLFNKGTYRDLGTLGGTESRALGINANGKVVGNSDLPSSGNQHAFLYDGMMHDLGTLGQSDADHSSSSAYAINATGQVTGVSSINAPGRAHAFLYDGTMHDLGTLAGGESSQGLALNAGGTVTGFGDIGVFGVTHAFVDFAESGMVDLNSLIAPGSAWVLESATAINDSGQIAGNGIIGGQEHAFLLTPEHGSSVSITAVPEPSGIFLGVGGVLYLLAGRAVKALASPQST